MNLWNVIKNFSLVHAMEGMLSLVVNLLLGYTDTLLASVGDFLLDVITNASLASSLAREAAETYALGFLLFKRLATERVLFLLHVLEKSRTCERYRLLSSVLLLQLSGWDRVSSILAENGKPVDVLLLA